MWKGSSDQKFFEILIDEVPDIGISIVERDAFPSRSINPHCVAIKATPYKTDRIFLSKLELSPVIQLLRSPWFSRNLGKKLEDEGTLAKGTTDRVLARAYQNDINELKALLADGPDFKLQKELENSQKLLTELGNVKPFSDEEVETLMRDTIREEYRQELGL